MLNFGALIGKYLLTLQLFALDSAVSDIVELFVEVDLHSAWDVDYCLKAAIWKPFFAFFVGLEQAINLGGVLCRDC